MAINWDMAVAPDIIGNAMQAFEKGKTQRREADTRNALSAYAQNPTEQGLNQLAVHAPEYAIKLRQQNQEFGIKQREQQSAQMQQVGRLLRTVQADPSKYALARQAAISIGAPAETIPEAYDPEWVAKNVMIADAYDKDGGQTLTTSMKELVALGYKPGTPEFQQALAQTINAGFAKPYVNPKGGTSLYSPNIAVPAQQPTQPTQPATPAPQQDAFGIDQWKGAVAALGAQKAAEWARKNGIRFRVNSPDEAMSLPSGTEFITPDGRIMRAP